MTTVAINITTRRAATDSFNSPDGGSPLLCQKAWPIKTESGKRLMFFESGHLRPIELALQWAEYEWSADERSEEWDEIARDTEKYAFACVLVGEDGVVQYLDEELAPIRVYDKYITLGTGGAYARGAMDAGASVEDAVEIAIRYDGNSGGPIQSFTLPHPNDNDVPF